MWTLKFRRHGLALLAAVLLTALWMKPARAALPDQVRVRLFEAHPQFQTFRLQGSFRVWSGSHSNSQSHSELPASTYRLTLTAYRGRIAGRCGQRQTLCYQGARLNVQALGGKPVEVTALHGNVSLPPRRYTGQLTFLNQYGRLAVFNTVPARHYVAVVIGSETGPDWPLEALKAQAVLTQTRLSRYKLGDALGDSTQQEAYLGEAYLKPAAEQAVRAVWGQTLTVDKQTIQPYYHASCGGHTSHLRWFVGQVLPSGQPDGVICPYCQRAPFARPTVSVLNAAQWRLLYSGAEPEASASKKTVPKVILRDASGRPLQVAVGSARISGYQFWLRLGQRLGWDKAPGTRFQLQALPNGQLRISSTGAGHGVGLCQQGAAEMARQGQRYDQILKFYFPQAHLSGL